MSYMKNKMLEIEEMLNDGFSPSEVADYFGMNLSDVMNFMSELGIIDDSEFEDLEYEF